MQFFIANLCRRAKHLRAKAAISSALILFICGQAKADAPLFEQRVQAIVSAKCSACHGESREKRKAELDLRSVDAMLDMHFPPRPKRMVLLFQYGSPSQIDLFDPRPALIKYADQEFGNKVADDPVAVGELHATLLQQFGLDHTRLTSLHQGRNESLTDADITGVKPVPALVG